ncbi:MAG: hypothetical protein AAF512_17540 [Pseudomonadota bacterium]
MKITRYLWRGVLSIALCSGIGAQAKPLIVVQSNPAELYPSGSVVEGAELELHSGQQLKVITGNGTVLNIQTGADGNLMEETDTGDNALSIALAEINGDPMLGNAMRNGRVPPKVWMANVESQGTYCAEGGSIKLWRANANQVTTLTMQQQGGGQAKKIKWAVGQDTYDWRFNSGKSYLAKMDSGANTANRLTFYQVPGSMRFTPKRVVWMAKKGCIQQAQRLFPW